MILETHALCLKEKRGGEQSSSRFRFQFRLMYARCVPCWVAQLRSKRGIAEWNKIRNCWTAMRIFFFYTISSFAFALLMLSVSVCSQIHIFIFLLYHTLHPVTIFRVLQQHCTCARCNLLQKFTCFAEKEKQSKKTLRLRKRHLFCRFARILSNTSLAEPFVAAGWFFLSRPDFCQFFLSFFFPTLHNCCCFMWDTRVQCLMQVSIFALRVVRLRAGLVNMLQSLSLSFRRREVDCIWYTHYCECARWKLWNFHEKWFNSYDIHSMIT